MNKFVISVFMLLGILFSLDSYAVKVTIVNDQALPLSSSLSDWRIEFYGNKDGRSVCRTVTFPAVSIGNRYTIELDDMDYILNGNLFFERGYKPLDIFCVTATKEGYIILHETNVGERKMEEHAYKLSFSGYVMDTLDEYIVTVGMEIVGRDARGKENVIFCVKREYVNPSLIVPANTSNKAITLGKDGG
jgi:hypothetical protein